MKRRLFYIIILSTVQLYANENEINNTNDKKKIAAKRTDTEEQEIKNSVKRMMILINDWTLWNRTLSDQLLSNKP